MDGSAGGRAGRSYVAPAVADYGDLVELTQDAGMMLHMGVGGFAAASTPGPGPSGGGDTPDGLTPTVAGVESTGTAPDTGGGAPGSPDANAVQGADNRGGSAGGADGGGGGKLPFTGFPAAVAGAVGGGLAAAGAAARSRLGKSS